MEHVRMRFYRVFNSIYAKTRAANSELVTVKLVKSYIVCLSYCMARMQLDKMTGLGLCKRTVSMLDNYVSTAIIAGFV